ncbi:hypothetical protein BDV97DRAFT_362649 [Delphinella strobiligena]|nr:hypothetical protein BDV97DRAFT_362649 [Delphinella strobiligena]
MHISWLLSLRLPYTAAFMSCNQSMCLAQAQVPSHHSHSASPVSFSSIACCPVDSTALVSGTCCSLQVLVATKERPCYSQPEYYNTAEVDGYCTPVVYM